MNATERLQARYEAALMPNYGTPPVALARGQGCQVWDVDGREYTDLYAGIAVSSLGHAHPALVDAVSRQVATLAHTSNLFLHEGEVALAERLLSLLSAGAPGSAGTPGSKGTPGRTGTPGRAGTPGSTGTPGSAVAPGAGTGRVFFANSGTEANEAAIKLVRRYQGPDRPVFVAAEGGFHGRTMGALALTGKSSIREPFGPFGLTVRFVPYGDAAALRAATRDDTAAVFLEPALGEGGVVPPPPGYLQAARDACDDSGALLVADEIQSGIGRTGQWFAHQGDGVTPDVLTLAKGLGGGLPIGACVGLGDAGTALRKGDHGSTFGGNPVACAAALAVLDTIEADGLLEHAAAVGRQLADGLAQMSHPLLRGVRGRGLWLAAVLTQPLAAQAEAAARDAGFLVNAVQPDAIRLAPALVFGHDQAAAFLGAWPAILDALSRSGGPVPDGPVPDGPVPDGPVPGGPAPARQGA